MWALRRASAPLKLRGLSVGIPRVCCAKSDHYVESNVVIFESPQTVAGTCLFHHASNVCFKFPTERRCLSSQASAENSKSESESDLDDGFSELETPTSVDAIEETESVGGNDDELVSEHDIDDNVGDGADLDEKTSAKQRDASELFKTIISSQNAALQTVLDKWLAEGKNLSRAQISVALLNLRKRRMFGRALQLSEWLEDKKQLEFEETDYASRLDLIAKNHGLFKAESYIEKIPESFRGELVYRTLLANCVTSNNVKKAEEIFNKMKDLDFPITTFSCNQLLLLYKRLDKKKIADVLLLMEKENVKPNLFTYKILIDTKGQSNDLAGMDQVLETMKAEGVEPDLNILAILGKHYVSGGLIEKAEAILEVMEGGNLNTHRWACKALLPLYAALGKPDEVKRVWKVCESNPRIDECVAAIDAWGRLKNVEEAEAVFEMMLSKWKKISSKHYSALLKVYASHKMLAKGKDLVKRMGSNGCKIGPLTWDALVKLYVEAGEVEKADSMLQKAAQQNKIKPLFSSYMAIMDHYAKRGDIHNAEKIFHKMRQAGYTARHRQFLTLVQAYINAKEPAYGIRERMKADNIFPNKALAAQLPKVDAFRRTPVSDLLD